MKISIVSSSVGDSSENFTVNFLSMKGEDGLRNINWKLKHGCMSVSGLPPQFYYKISLIAELIAISLTLVGLGRKAKRESKKKFYRDLEDTSNASRLYKVLSKDSGFPGFLMNIDDSFTESSNDNMRLVKNQNCRATRHPQEKVEWTESSFDPYKSAGLD